MFRPGLVILFSLLFGRAAMGVRREVVHLRGALVILVMRSVVIAGRHKLKRHHLPGFRVGFLCKLISAVRVFQRTLGMPVTSRVIPFFIVLGGRAMGVCREFMLLGGSPV
jgi:hypothetical protein